MENKQTECSGHLCPCILIKLTWHLSFADVLKILSGNPCFNVNYSIKHSIKKKKLSFNISLHLSEAKTSGLQNPKANFGPQLSALS